MSDPLKDFIDANRDAFDDAAPSPEVLSSLSWKLKKIKAAKARQRSVWTILSTAAAAAALVLLIYGLNRKEAIPSSATPWTAEQTIVPQIIEVERYYTLQVNKRKAALVNYQSVEPNLQAETNEALHYLDSSYTDLKQQLSTNANQEKIRNAMVNNLKMRIDILNTQLNKLMEVKSTTKRKENEKINL